MTINILIVDDELNALHGLRRSLRGKDYDWETILAQSGPEALAVLNQQPCDVLITDVHMPEMDGLELLRQVKKFFPELIRVTFSGDSSQEAPARLFDLAHTCLPKPCRPEVIRAMIRKVLRAKRFLGEKSSWLAMGNLPFVPIAPGCLSGLVAEIQSRQQGLTSISTMVSKCPSLAARAMQMANSPIYDPEVGEVRGIDQAVAVLGRLGMMDLCRLCQACPPPMTTDWAGKQLAWSHDLGIRTAGLAQAMAKDLGWNPTDCQSAYTLGLLHVVGRLILTCCFVSEYVGVLNLSAEYGLLLPQAEKEIFGCTNAEVGAYILGLWGLPTDMVEALAVYHCPFSRPTIDRVDLPTILHVATFLAGQAGDPAVSGHPCPLDTDYLHHIGLMGHLPRWQVLMEEMFS